jgi:hypothetical protein
MSGPRTKWLPNAIVLLWSLGLIGHATTPLAQDVTRPRQAASEPPPPHITLGTVVDADQQRRLGLVAVNDCSGTLLNRYWVVTARHCVTSNGQIDGPLLAPNKVKVSAAWAPGQIVVASRIRDFAVNVASRGSADIVLFYLGSANLGEVNSQPVFAVERSTPDGSAVVIGRLATTDTVIQYGRGFSTFATGNYEGDPPAVAASGAGVYRSAVLTPSSIAATGYILAMSRGQVGHGGDSGGPTVAVILGASAGIAGVQSGCRATGYVGNAPTRDWKWATGISHCEYVSTEQFLTEIRDAISETPGCQFGPACAIPAIVAAAMPETPRCQIDPACAIPAIVFAAMPPTP